MGELRDISLEAWKDIFESRIGKEQLRIGTDIFPPPQIIGFLLHELIPNKLAKKYPKEWTKDKTAKEKDLVYIPNPDNSIEIKTSSHPKQIFGNRSYGQKQTNPKKDKSGYYLAINFEGFTDSKKPKIRLIRFGWLDHSDWIAQEAATGQQAHLTNEANNLKLLTIYPI